MKTTKRKLNVRLIRKIQNHITEEPRRFMMWTVKIFGKPGLNYISDSDKYEPFPACGTAQCIAGWALTLSGHPRSVDLRKARLLLGLDVSKSVDVFLSDSWPEPFQSRYLTAVTPLSRARIAVKRLEHLITTGE